MKRWEHLFTPGKIGSLYVKNRIVMAHPQLRQRRTIAPADLSGSFAPFLQFQKREIHTVFPRFRNFELAQNLSLSCLAELCGAALKNRPYPIFRAGWDKVCFYDCVQAAEQTPKPVKRIGWRGSASQSFTQFLHQYGVEYHATVGNCMIEKGIFINT